MMRGSVGNRLFGYDVCLPKIEDIYRIVDGVKENVLEIKKNIEKFGATEATGFGHMGDGNLHLQFAYKGMEDEATMQEFVSGVEDYVFKEIKSLNGSNPKTNPKTLTLIPLFEKIPKI